MLERKSFGFAVAAFFLCASVVMAGDVATFVDLGFSGNGNYYMFGQYGVIEDSLKPWAELYIVDIASNDFVKNGRISYKHNEKISAGQDGSGALLKALADNNDLITKYNANFMKNGIPLFISLKNGHNPQGDSIDFRDFEWGNRFWADLVPAVFGSGKNIRSSFFIKMRKDGKGGAKNYRVGSPDVKRAGVTSYTIKRVIVNPQRTSMILVIEMTVLNGSGPDVRYMIEAIRL